MKYSVEAVEWLHGLGFILGWLCSALWFHHVENVVRIVLMNDFDHVKHMWCDASAIALYEDLNFISRVAWRVNLFCQFWEYLPWTSSGLSAGLDLAGQGVTPWLQKENFPSEHRSL